MLKVNLFTNKKEYSIVDLNRVDISLISSNKEVCVGCKSTSVPTGKSSIRHY